MRTRIDPFIYYSNLECFVNQIFGNVRSITINGEPWFVGSDVARCLGYVRPDNAIREHVYDNYKHFFSCTELGGLNLELNGKNNYGAYLINEAGLYQLIFTSKLPSARAFADWIFSEVLPTMRKIGFARSMQLYRQEIDRVQEENHNLRRNNNIICDYNRYLEAKSNSMMYGIM